MTSHISSGLGSNVLAKRAVQGLQQAVPDDGSYLLQIDGQIKRSFKSFEVANAAALEIKTRFPIVHVSIYDTQSKSRRAVGGALQERRG